MQSMLTSAVTCRYSNTKVSEMASAAGFLHCMRELTEASHRQWLLIRRYAAVENSFMIPRWKFAWEADGGVYGEGDANHPSHRAYALLQLLRNMSNSRPDEPLLMVELGVCWAATSEALLKRMPGLRMILVDRVIFPVAQQRMQPYANRTTWINDLSTVASSKVADGSADLVFIDAAHDYKSVQEDLLHWASKVRPGGILAGHDYLAEPKSEWSFPVLCVQAGVVTAVNEFVLKHDALLWLLDWIGFGRRFDLFGFYGEGGGLSGFEAQILISSTCWVHFFFSCGRLLALDMSKPRQPNDAMAAPIAPIVLDEDTWTCDNPNIVMVKMPEMSHIPEGERPVVMLRLPDGTMADIQTMNLPSNVKRLLSDIDMDRNGVVDDPNVDHVVKMLEMMREEFGCEKGHVAQEEMDKALILMSNLLRQKRENSADMSYRHLSPCIQAIKPAVALHELTEAAHAYKKVKKEGRRMKKMIIGLCCVIGVLLTGMFVLSYVAADMAKEMRSSGDGVMRAQGEVVKVASSDFTLVDGQLVARGEPTAAECGTNTTCRRLQRRGGFQKPLQTAPATKRVEGICSQSKRSNFDRLKALDFRCAQPLHLPVDKVMSAEMRECNCGLVMNIHTKEGIVTLDGCDVYVDDPMFEFLEQAQCARLTKKVRKRGGQPPPGRQGRGGRRGGRQLLGATDILDGTFEWFEEGEEPCESNPLPDPQSIPQYYRAEVRITELHPDPQVEAFSQYFSDANGSALTLPGIVSYDGKVYKTWTEEVVRAADSEVHVKRYAMHPLQAELHLMKAGVLAQMDLLGSRGFRCQIGDGDLGAESFNFSWQPSMEYQGTVAEPDGRILRHWRTEVLKGLDLSTLTEDENFSVAVLEAGLSPNIIDYYDVDTDPSQVFQSGQPYRIHAFSTVPGSTVDRMTEYLTMEAVDASKGLAQVLEELGVSSLDGDCDVDEDEDDADATADSHALAAEIQGYLSQADDDDDIDEPPEIDPWVEMPSALLFNYEMLQGLVEEDTGSPFLEIATGSLYWTSLFTMADNQDVLDAFLLNTSDERRLSETEEGEIKWSARDRDGRCAIEIEADMDARRRPRTSQIRTIQRRRPFVMKMTAEFDGTCEAAMTQKSRLRSVEVEPAGEMCQRNRAMCLEKMGRHRARLESGRLISEDGENETMAKTNGFKRETKSLPFQFGCEGRRGRTSCTLRERREGPIGGRMLSGGRPQRGKAGNPARARMTWSFTNGRFATNFTGFVKANMWANGNVVLKKGKELAPPRRPRNRWAVKWLHMGKRR
ncbi:hypothetical protein AK812_SmicGene21710 [Symbiodinium microadriaticum]|uniref:Uncharacterized protein n=1 Tax=Symbiodinium microadriaticum TaxID=2951 RepID=A0A1Q9DLN8_SYMMI|nr:hypothetical protein AK812_SmicGene21710 [Symbiodinium microadriaticum]